MWVERPGARGSRARPERTAQTRVLPPARAAALHVPMDQCAHPRARAPWQAEQMLRDAARSRAARPPRLAHGGAVQRRSVVQSRPPTAQRPNGRRGPARERAPYGGSRTPSGDDARRCAACLCVAAGRRAAGVAVAGKEMAVVDGGGCEREASGGEYASRCAPCGVMHACIGDRAATGEAARYRCLRVVLVLVVACASTLPQPHGDTHTF